MSNLFGIKPSTYEDLKKEASDKEYTMDDILNAIIRVVEIDQRNSKAFEEFMKDPYFLVPEQKDTEQ